MPDGTHAAKKRSFPELPAFTGTVSVDISVEKAGDGRVAGAPGIRIPHLGVDFSFWLCPGSSPTAAAFMLKFRTLEDQAKFNSIASVTLLDSGAEDPFQVVVHSVSEKPEQRYAGLPHEGEWFERLTMKWPAFDGQFPKQWMRVVFHVKDLPDIFRL